MSKQKTPPKNSPEVRERALRMFQEHAGEHASQCAAIVVIAAKIGCTPQMLQNWMAQAERDRGLRSGVTTDERARMKALERENRALRQANEILHKASAYFARFLQDWGGARRPVQAMIAFIDAHRADFGVEPICRVLKLASSTYHAETASRIDPSRRAARARRDMVLKEQVRRVFDENFGLYGARKVWRQM